MDEARYPRQFDLVRLAAVGDPLFLTVAEARQRYDAGKSLRVLDRGERPSWFLMVSPKQHRFTLTRYAPSTTPVREVMWEAEGGRLRCRRIRDLYYPDGDPGVRRPLVEIVVLTQQVTTEGTTAVTLSGMGRDRTTTATGPLLPDRELPQFGEWAALVDASSVSLSERFGPGAAATAGREFAARSQQS